MKIEDDDWIVIETSEKFNPSWFPKTFITGTWDKFSTQLTGYIYTIMWTYGKYYLMTWTRDHLHDICSWILYLSPWKTSSDSIKIISNLMWHLTLLTQ